MRLNNGQRQQPAVVGVAPLLATVCRANMKGLLLLFLDYKCVQINGRYRTTSLQCGIYCSIASS